MRVENIFQKKFWAQTGAETELAESVIQDQVLDQMDRQSKNCADLLQTI